MLTVSFVLLLVIISGRFVKYLAEAASGELAADVLFSIMAYRLPGFLELILPLGLFIGILLAYGRLYVESEMIVLSACGISTVKLAIYTLIPSLVVAVLVAGLSLYVTPLGTARVQEIFSDPATSQGVNVLAAGRFRDSDNGQKVSYAESVTGKNNTMHNVFLSERRRDDDGRSKLHLTLAERGEVKLDGSGSDRYLELSNGYQYRGNPGERDFRVIQFERFGELIKDDADRDALGIESNSKSTQVLLKSSDAKDIAALQWRLSLPLLVPIVALLALALSKTDHRRGRFIKLLPAFLLYMAYLVLLSAARNALEKQSLSPALGLWWVHFFFASIAIILLFGPEWWRRFSYKTSGGARHAVGESD
jgi:lipopolysaccharide export system permease protein